jgi:hypothetical protein
VDTIEQWIAGRYLGIWSRDVAAGRPPGDAEPRPVLVDVSDDGPTRVSSVAAAGGGPAHPLPSRLGALTDSAALRTAVVALREDPAAAAAAHAALLAAGWSERARRVAEGGPADGIEAGRAYVWEAGLAAAAPALGPLLEPATDVLVHAAPAGPAALPFASLRPLLDRPAADLLLRLPIDDLDRLARYRATPVADLPLLQRRLAEAYSSMLGDARWEWLALWRGAMAAGGAAAARARVAEHFRVRLAEAAPGAVVRRFVIPLGEPVGGTAGPGELHLVLVTCEPERILDLNLILLDLREAGRIPWVEPTDPSVRLENPGILDLFDGRAAPTGDSDAVEGFGPRVRRVDIPALAHRLEAEFANRSLPLREVMARLALTDLLPDEVRQALRLLRRQGRAAYTSLRSADDPIHFRLSGVQPPARRRATRRITGPELW